MATRPTHDIDPDTILIEHLDTSAEEIAENRYNNGFRGVNQGLPEGTIRGFDIGPAVTSIRVNGRTFAQRYAALIGQPDSPQKNRALEALDRQLAAVHAISHGVDVECRDGQEAQILLRFMQPRFPNAMLHPNAPNIITTARSPQGDTQDPQAGGPTGVPPGAPPGAPPVRNVEPPPPPPPPQGQQNPVRANQSSVRRWMRRHWLGLTLSGLGLAGAAATVGSCYMKGKHDGLAEAQASLETLARVKEEETDWFPPSTQLVGDIEWNGGRWAVSFPPGTAIHDAHGIGYPIDPTSIKLFPTAPGSIKFSRVDLEIIMPSPVGRRTFQCDSWLAPPRGTTSTTFFFKPKP